MFTSMDIDEDLFMRAWALSGQKTKKALIEEVLRTYVRLHEQAEIRGLRGKLVWQGDLEQQRKGRRRANPR